MRIQQMRAGVWLYGLATALTGSLDIFWRQFDASHQPIKSFARNIPGEHFLASVAGILLVAAGLAILWHRTAKIGAAVSGVLYSIFIAFWLLRGYTGVHALGWRMNVIFGVCFGAAQQLWLLAPAAIIYVSANSARTQSPARIVVATRLIVGLPPIVFGLGHLVGIHIFANIVPKWMSFATFWAGLTGIAFFLAGCAISSGIRDILAARLLALMLLLFEALVETPPVFIRPNNQAAWGAAVYNLTAIATCWMFAELLASRTDRSQVESEGEVTISGNKSLVA